MRFYAIAMGAVLFFLWMLPGRVGAWRGIASGLWVRPGLDWRVGV